MATTDGKAPAAQQTLETGAGRNPPWVSAAAARRRQIAELQNELEREKERTGDLDVDAVAHEIGRRPPTVQALARKHAIGRKFGGLGTGGTYLFTEADVEKLRELAPGRTGRPPAVLPKGQVTLTQAAEIIGVSNQVVSAEYVPNGQLVPLGDHERRHGKVVPLDEREVKRFAKSRPSSPDKRVQRRFNREYVERHSLDCGLSRPEAHRRGAAAPEHKKRLNRIRVDTGRPPLGIGDRLRAAFDALDDFDYAEHKPITKQERYRTVYATDWEDHPEDWDRDEYPASPLHGGQPDPETYRRGAGRVSKLLSRRSQKPLQIA